MLPDADGPSSAHKNLAHRLVSLQEFYLYLECDQILSFLTGGIKRIPKLQVLSNGEVSPV